MNKFIEVTGFVNGAIVVVRCSDIIAISKSASTDSTELYIKGLTGNHAKSLNVKESVEDIEKRMGVKLI